ncbi:site-specific DNA-methyltransferase [Thiohalocapsa sp. ML1]|uniref:site-specific DNA-methyltransferase n=1 Tax=Thiohalocapsa sp. ML1 TaxID=1431688 RepID=UPI00073236B2|nr:site-specific DNA-methyltransferase [Thiohalocapsa sp. ML1]
MANKDQKTIEALTHAEARRTNIPTAEYQPVLADADRQPQEVRYPRGGGGLADEKAARDPDLDPQLVWRGKDRQDWSDLVVQAPPLFIQEKIHPKVLIDDLVRRSGLRDAGASALAPRLPRGSEALAARSVPEQLDLFADFNGIAAEVDKTEFYRHDAHWTNRMILGDSLQVMASLAEREGLRGKVQCIYIDPPYGIKFNSNFQWSTTSRDVKDGNTAHITREPEQVKAFRDTWRDGIHSYLTYLRDRLTVARDLLTDSGSVFVQIGDENVHRIRALLDDLFGEENHIAQILFVKTSGRTPKYLPSISDYILWYGRDASTTKYRKLLAEKEAIDNPLERYVCIETNAGDILDLTVRQKQGIVPVPNGRIVRLKGTDSQGAGESRPVSFQGRQFRPTSGRHWSVEYGGIAGTFLRSGHAFAVGTSLRRKAYHESFPFRQLTNNWDSIRASGFGVKPNYIVYTLEGVIERCLLMTTDPGDLVLDPTCGSGTTAYVAEQWGRRWITIDTSRVALALARARIMGARYPYYLLADSRAGQQKEAEVTRTAPSTAPTRGDIRQGFVYQRVPHVTLKSIANNAEIDVIWEDWQPKVQSALERLNAALRRHATPYTVGTGGRAGKQVRFDAPDAETFTMPSGEVVPAHQLTDWEVPRDAPADWPASAAAPLGDFWHARIARQREIDASIAAKADYEYLYDKPYEDRQTVRVAGPFTVESLSPHRVLGVDENDELIGIEDDKPGYGEARDFAALMLESLRAAGVQQAHKDGRIRFTSLTPWPGELICAEGRYPEPGADTPDAPGSPGFHAPAWEPGQTLQRRGAAAPEPEPRDAGASARHSDAGASGRGDAEASEPGSVERRAAIFIGPEFGTVSRPDLVQAAREAADAGFDVLIACAFSYDAHSADLSKLGRLPILKARMNADLHMATELADTGKGNLFVIFGEPDIDVLDAGDGLVQVKINGVDVFHPQSGEVRSDGPDGIACWFIDTDYNEESFFVRHAYFLGANDPYKALKTTLRAEIDEDAWASLNSDTSRPFPKPASGRIAVKVINHLGDEVMKVFRV